MIDNACVLVNRCGCCVIIKLISKIISLLSSCLRFLNFPFSSYSTQHDRTFVLRIGPRGIFPSSFFVTKVNFRKTSSPLTHLPISVHFIQHHESVGELLVKRQLARVEAQVGAVDGVAVVVRVVDLLVCGVHEHTLQE